MSYIPCEPNPYILRCFAEPHSLTQVARETGWRIDRVWRHVERARRLLFVAEAGKIKDKLTCGVQRLYELTPAGVDFLEANDDGE